MVKLPPFQRNCRFHLQGLALQEEKPGQNRWVYFIGKGNWNSKLKKVAVHVLQIGPRLNDKPDFTGKVLR
jgi:hypothetical protein